MSMDARFLRTGIGHLLPVVIILSFLFVTGHRSSDYYFHAYIEPSRDYPSGLASIISVFPLELHGSVLFIINLLTTTVIPYCLICEITKKQNAAALYLWSGIPLVLFTVWLVPQSIIHCMMLASIAYPPFFVVFALTGWTYHAYWFAGVALVFLYRVFKEEMKNERLPFRSVWLSG